MLPRLLRTSVAAAGAIGFFTPCKHGFAKLLLAGRREQLKRRQPVRGR